MALSYALWAVSRSFPVFVLSRMVAGISKGNIGISAAVVVDVTNKERRNRGMVSRVEHLYCTYNGTLAHLELENNNERDGAK